MKTKMILTKGMKVWLLFLTFLFQGCCDSVCELLKLADLIIPRIVQHFNNQGVPIFKSSNELYYNERTREFFNKDRPPRLGLRVGDYIQLATRIYNTVANDDCKTGAAAPRSTTAPELTITSSNFNGIFPTPSMITPPISAGSNTLTATRFQLITPGTYKINFNANAPRNIKEHSYTNNFYYGQNGNYSRVVSKDFSFKVKGEREINSSQIDRRAVLAKIEIDAPQSIQEMKNLLIYKFAISDEFKDWVKENHIE